MAKRPHLYFRGEQLLSGDFSYLGRDVSSGDDEEDQREPEYSPMQDTFRHSLERFTRKRQVREEQRNPEIEVGHIDFIQLNFFNVFKVSKFEKTYRERFGLSPVSFKNYNRTGLFAIENPGRFEQFIGDVQHFIEAEDPLETDEYSPVIRFIKSFDGFSTGEILQISESHPKVVLDFIKTPRLYAQFIEPIRIELQSYLQEEGINFELNPTAETIELEDPSWESLVEIAQNFDIVQSVSSHDSGIIRPSPFGVPIREYGLTVSEENIEDLPIIGVLDSGVNDQNPLEPILVRGGVGYDLTGNDPFDDQVDHGTGVAGLAALGTKPYPDFQGEINADAQILPIKIISENNTPVSQKGVVNAIRRAHEEYNVKIFVLAVTWVEHKRTHEQPSEYTYALDQVANELDVLIFISTGNRETLFQPVGGELLDYPSHFLEELSNIETPADSMNNICIGAVADDLRDQEFEGFSIDESYPAVYSRKNNLDWTDESLKRTLVNLQLIKPDILMPGGDFDKLTNPDVHGLQVLSSDTGIFYNKQPGTSYSAPLAANLAARMLRRYPSITNMQTIKALLINSAEEIGLGPEFDSLPKRTRTAVSGRGRPKENSALYSDDHRATFILEGEIRPEKMEVFELRLPKYLNDLYKDRSLLRVSATLCFSFDPVPNNHLAYCPIHFAFGFFRNIPAKEITSRKQKEVRLKEGWTEDYYFGDKILSNTQKVNFVISKPDLVSEDNLVRLGVHCRLHKHLDADRKVKNNRLQSYSLAISLEEDTLEDKREHNLYDELIAINRLEAIGDIDIDLEV